MSQKQTQNVLLPGMGAEKQGGLQQNLDNFQGALWFMENFHRDLNQ